MIKPADKVSYKGCSTCYYVLKTYYEPHAYKPTVLRCVLQHIPSGKKYDNCFVNRLKLVERNPMNKDEDWIKARTADNKKEETMTPKKELEKKIKKIHTYIVTHLCSDGKPSGKVEVVVGKSSLEKVIKDDYLTRYNEGDCYLPPKVNIVGKAVKFNISTSVVIK